LHNDLETLDERIDAHHHQLNDHGPAGDRSRRAS
jgi:hypothetical protein